ncbi:D-alanine--D-alanine ligase family protein [Aestuariimicrobium kwangyangense]|uniref:D-alanine--D-alanine ligase family protein n=1 Tax=Aestuariimicrobium kwangyangense TaxID=396389 RepID=UPI001FE16EB6|nr:D-alanine--D-alanine ligase [Aestuariimicrobium kwangyangense]
MSGGTMTDRPDVIVLAGGLSHERDVSQRSGRRVAIALRQAGHTVIESDVNAGVVDLVRSHPGAVVFPLLHGGVGEDGALREVFQLLGVPFVGATASSSRVTFDKSIATPVVAAHGVRTPRQVALPHEIFRELGAAALVDAIGETLGLPVMVKPARSGSALGASKVELIDDLPSAMVSAYAYGSVAVVEEFIEGTEVTVTVLGEGDEAEALPAVEIRPDSGVYDYASRYTAGSTRFVTPAEVPDEVAAACAELALSAYRALGLRDLGRIDIMINSAGEPVFIEGNVAPGMTETSAVPLALSAAGRDLGEVCSALVRGAAARG